MIIVAPNGYFTSGNKIYIDFNAGNMGEGMMLYTLSHELGHYIAKWNAQDFKAISDFLIKHYGENFPFFEQLEAQKNKLRKSYKEDGKQIPGDTQLEREAHEELVCDMLSRMLADKNAYDKLTELKQTDLKLHQKLGRAIKKLLNKIAEAIGIYDTLAPDAVYAASTESIGEEAFRQLQDMYIKAFLQADANFQAAEKNTTEEGGVKMMVRENVVDVDGNIYKKVIKPGLTVYNSVKHKKKDYISHLRKKIFKRTFNVNDINGEQITIEFGKDGEVVQKDGFDNPHPVLGELEATTDRLKMIAVINIKELIKNSEPLTPKRENKHQWLDDGGWNDRISYMADFDFVYPVILHIPKTRDGRYLLYDVSVLKKKGSSIDTDATALAALSARAPETTENGLQSAVEVLEPSGGRLAQPEPVVNSESAEVLDIGVDKQVESEELSDDTKRSDRDYSYDALIAKPDMQVTTVDGNVPKNRADVVYQAKQNAAKVGKLNPKDGSVSVRVKDVDADVILGTKGLEHGLRRLSTSQSDPTWRITLKAGEIIKNAIRINEITPSKDDPSGAYVLVGAAKTSDGDTYVVRFVVNQYSNELTSLDVLYAINAKKEDRLRSMRPGFQHPVTDPIISIADLLDIVNQHFPDILPEGVLRHYGYDARPDGDLGKDALYQERDDNSVSNRSLLANAFESMAQNDIEKQKIAGYREKLETMEAEEQKLHDLNEQIKELSFAKGPRDTQKIRKLQLEARQTANRIGVYDKQLLRLEATKPLQNILWREKKKAYKKAEQRGKQKVL